MSNDEGDWTAQDQRKMWLHFLIWNLNAGLLRLHSHSTGIFVQVCLRNIKITCKRKDMYVATCLKPLQNSASTEHCVYTSLPHSYLSQWTLKSIYSYHKLYNTTSSEGGLSPWAFARVNLSLQQNFAEGRYIVTQLYFYLLLPLLLLQCMQYCSSQFVGCQIQLVSCG